MTKGNNIKLRDVRDEGTTTKSFRLKRSTVAGLQQLTTRVNNKLNIKLSMNNIVELLITEALEGGEDRLIKTIKKS